MNRPCQALWPPHAKVWNRKCSVTGYSLFPYCSIPRLTTVGEDHVNGTLLLSADSRSTAGVLLLTIVAIEYGGWFMLRVVRGNQPATPFQAAFFRAGHAHAGVLVILALVSQILVSGAHIGGLLGSLASNALWVAAILM